MDTSIEMAPRKKVGKSGSRGEHTEPQQESETSDQDQLHRLGRAFRDYMSAAQEIERIYLKEPHTAEVIRAAAVTLQKALDIAAAKAGGFAFGPRPMPLGHVFAGLNDVESGIYNRILTPAKHKFGKQYDTHHRRMIIGHALAVWDVVVASGGTPSKVMGKIVDALNRAGFRVPVTRKRSSGAKTSGEVTPATLEQWRKRARSDKVPYAATYREARKNLEDLLRRLDADRQPHSVEILIDHFEKLVEAHRIDE